MAAMKYWVWFSALRLSPKSKQALMDHFHQDPERIYFSTPQQILKVDGLTPGDRERLKDRQLDTAMDILGRCDADGIRIVTMQDAAYPERLKHIYDPPAVLYVK